jgi:Protein of unknown function (DUF3558)
MRPALTMLAGTALCVALASCGGETPGTPAAADTTGPGASTSTSKAPSLTTTAPSGPSLTGVDPCQLLAEPERTQLGLPAGTRSTTLGNPTCEWNPRGGAIVDLTLWTTRGLAELNTSNSKITELMIGSHQGRRLEHNEPGICDVDIAVAAKSSVTVGALHDQTAQACALAEQVARLIEPNLPRG